MSAYATESATLQRELRLTITDTKKKPRLVYGMTTFFNFKTSHNNRTCNKDYISHSTTNSYQKCPGRFQSCATQLPKHFCQWFSSCCWSRIRLGQGRELCKLATTGIGSLCWWCFSNARSQFTTPGPFNMRRMEITPDMAFNLTSICSRLTFLSHLRFKFALHFACPETKRTGFAAKLPIRSAN